MEYLQKYSTFIKLEHSLFSIPLFFAGAFLAEGRWPDFQATLLILTAGISARVVAMILNRLIDRRIDALNPRTKDRHLASGTMTVMEAWVIAFIALCAYLWAAWSLSDFCLRLAWIPLAGFTIYPYLKRFTKWAHVGLGIVWSLVPLSGFFGVKPSLEGVLPVVMLGLFTVFWLAGFDIIYATSDEEFDRKAGLFSLPACWGSERALRMARFFHGLAFLMLLVLYVVWFSGPITVMLLMIVGFLLYLEQKLSLYVDVAFFQMNVIVGFAVLFFVMSGIKGV